MNMKEFKQYIDYLILHKEKFIEEHRKELMTTSYGKIQVFTEYEREMIILKEYKDLRKVINS